MYPELIQWKLSHLYSDHFPILLLEGGRWGGSMKPFRFENMWLKVDSFMEMVREWWQGYVFSGSPSFVVNMKLKALKSDLKVWNRDVFGDLNFRKASLLQELSSLDCLDESGNMDDKGKERKLFVSKELDC